MPFQWLKHAFAVESATKDPPTPAQLAAAERICREIVRRRLTTPAIAFLEMSRPLNYVGAQTLHFFDPIMSALLEGDEHRRFAEFLERRDSIEHLCRRIEQIEAEAGAREGSPQRHRDTETQSD
ncbi:MAG: hypothetical protein DWQ34_04005 [Planctomycetota bacterium]|nr:MAG: hypothetical protein DWQ29_15295 [Planctomycetota bacterium]REJ96408.1 MAG: hypothetical protein DWQ34_04005 [Planctomycetota bacterium]REK29679.1 MAG: hypothetical protein DWQ41_03310 [Planctomycetota bacterium]REK30500.1 MAG: hypothetical protein DWQ45_21725 [Planctomycetota bacterium]